MKIELANKITNLIDAYRESTTALNDDIKTAIDRWTEFAIQNKLNPIMLKESAFKDISEARATATKTAVVLNQKLKLIVKDAKQQLIPSSLNADERPADYEARVNNALQFLSYQFDNLIDESTFMILKDFINDYEQMQLFKGVIEKHTDIMDADGIQLFPKTFGKLIESEVLLNTMNEIEMIAENLFTYPKTQGQTYMFGNISVMLAENGYEEIDGEQTILKFAQDIDSMTVESFKIDDNIPDNEELEAYINTMSGE